MKNIEGYQDPTPGAAFGNIRREEHKREADRLSVISNLIPIMKQTAELAGFEVVGRIVLKDKHTGKEDTESGEATLDFTMCHISGRNLEMIVMGCLQLGERLGMFDGRKEKPE